MIRLVAFAYPDSPRKCAIICEVLAETEDFIEFKVLNGGWEGTYSYSHREIAFRRSGTMKAELLWCGYPPPEYDGYDYNIMIKWMDDFVATRDKETAIVQLLNTLPPPVQLMSGITVGMCLGKSSYITTIKNRHVLQFPLNTEVFQVSDYQ